MILAPDKKATTESPENKVDCKIASDQFELVKLLDKDGTSKNEIINEVPITLNNTTKS